MRDQSRSDLETRAKAKADLESQAESQAESRVEPKADLEAKAEPAAATELEVNRLLAKLAQASPERLNEVADETSVQASDATAVETVVETAAETVVETEAETAGRPSWAKLRQEMFYFASGQWDKIMPRIWTPERAARERRCVLAEIKGHRVAVLLLLSLILSFKTIILWVLFVALWSLSERLYKVLPAVAKIKLDGDCQGPLSRLRDSGWLDELAEAVAYTRPFFVFALYMFLAPFALIWMTVHWCQQVFAGRTKALKPALEQTSGGGETLVFVQNKSKDLLVNQADFFHSPAFALTTVVIFAGGIPAAITLGLYRYLNMDALLGHPSADPQFFVVIVVICFYLSSLGWCLSTLFFRAWFTFPLNFLTSEHELELNQKRIKRRSYKGWFLSVLTMNNPAVGTSSIDWEDVTTVNARNATGAKFYPLPEAAFVGWPSALRRTLNNLALFYDSVSNKIDHSQFVTISTAQGVGGWGSEIDINLSELSAEQRARLFYAVRKWAPSASVSEEAQERLIGSSVMKEAKYTEIWFDLLTQKQDPKKNGRTRLSELSPGDTLRAGSLEVIERLGSGGQATAYLTRLANNLVAPASVAMLPASKEEGSCVLKEFILSDSDTVGALIQSAAEFELEASLLSQLDHPRVVKLIDCFSEDRRVYLVLEHVTGKSLRRMVKEEGPLAEDKVVEIALQICQVVGYLHGQNPPLVHRDLAPDNIIYEEGRGIKLIDFSLACASSSGSTSAAAHSPGAHSPGAHSPGAHSPGAQSSGAQSPTAHSPATSGARRTNFTSAVGKHAYTPPELFAEEVSVQSDLYALGATMYFLLTGLDPKPLTRSNPSGKNPAVSKDLSRIVERATELDLAKRYEEISWLKLDLEGH